MLKTCVERTPYTVEFSPQCKNVPYILEADSISKAVANVGKFLEKPLPTVPFPTLRNGTLVVLKILVEIADMDAPPGVEEDQTEYKSKRWRRSPHLNYTSEPKKRKNITGGKDMAGPVHTADPTESNKNSVKDNPTESAVRQGASSRVDANNTSTNVPRASPRLKYMQQRNGATPAIPEKEQRKQ